MKTILVKEIYKTYGLASLRIFEDASLEYVIAYLGHEPKFSGIFLVNSEKRFSGAIMRNDLIEWISLKLFGCSGKQEIREAELLRIVNAKKAKDLVCADYRALAVSEDDTLQTALDKMLNFKEDILPVLDAEDHILGDLRLSEICSKILDAGKSSNE